MNQVIVEKIPQELKDVPQWVCWKAVPKGNGKVDKIPINPSNGRKAATDNPKTWVSFDKAVTYYRKRNGKGIDGIGFVFSKEDPFMGIDLDDSVKNGNMELQAQAYIDKIYSYGELSPSGNGVHVITKAKIPGPRRRNGNVEIYEDGRFFTITGDHLEDTPATIEGKQKEIESFYNDVFGREEEKSKPIETKPTLLSNSEILERATSAKNGEKFSKLMKGDYSDYPSQSEADLALCNELAFWCGNNPEQIDRLFRQSKLYRKKWDEKHGAKTYGKMTILKAIQNTTETFTLGGGIYEEPAKNHTLEMLNENEVGDARLFIELNYGKFVYDHSIGRWYEWHKHYWKEDVSNRAMGAVEGVIRAYSQEVQCQEQKRLQAEIAKRIEEANQCNANIQELFKRIRALQSAKRRENVLKLGSVDWTQEGYKSLAITGNEWDRNLMLLGCKNGVVELTTGDFRPGKPEDYIKTTAPTEWKGIDTPAPMWERFLKEIFDDDTELIDYIQRLLGYASTGKVTEHIFPILFGNGRNGKGTLLETMRYVLRDLAGPVEAEILLEQYRARQSGSPTSDLMALRGKRLVWASETKEGRSLNIGKLKWLTGADTRVGRPPFGKHQITYTPTDTLFLLTNHKPRVPANDYSTWERIHLIPFKLSFVNEPTKDFERQRDPDLLDKLKAEAPGILAWIVRGSREWTYQGLNPPKTIKAATADYRKDEDIIGHFISDRCVLVKDLVKEVKAEVKAGELYKAYQKWCEEMGHKSINGTRFGKEMKTRFDSYKERHTYYIGIKLISD